MTSELPCSVIISTGISSFELSSSEWKSSRLLTSDLTNIIFMVWFRVISTTSDVPACDRPAVAAGSTALRLTLVATISWLSVWVFCVFSNFPFDVLGTTSSSLQGLVPWLAITTVPDVSSRRWGSGMVSQSINIGMLTVRGTSLINCSDQLIQQRQNRQLLWVVARL